MTNSCNFIKKSIFTSIFISLFSFTSVHCMNLGIAYLNGTIKIWDVESGKEIKTLEQYKGSKISIEDFSPDGNLLAIKSPKVETPRILHSKIWNLKNGTEEKSLLKDLLPPKKDCPSWISMIRFNPDGKTFAALIRTSKGSKIVKIVNKISGRVKHTLSNEDNIDHIAFSPDGKTLITYRFYCIYLEDKWAFHYSEEKKEKLELITWNTTTGKTMQYRYRYIETTGKNFILSTPVFAYKESAFPLLSNQLSKIHNVWIMDIESLEFIPAFYHSSNILEPNSTIQSIRVSPDGKTFATLCENSGVIKLYTGKYHKKTSLLKDNKQIAKSAEFIGQNKLAVIYKNGIARIWDTKNLRVISTFQTVDKNYYTDPIFSNSPFSSAPIASATFFRPKNIKKTFQEKLNIAREQKNFIDLMISTKYA